MPFAQQANFYNRLLEQIESPPGAKRAGVIERFFISGSPERMLTTEGSAGTVFRAPEVPK
jgi:hypothetical protein